MKEKFRTIITSTITMLMIACAFTGCSSISKKSDISAEQIVIQMQESGMPIGEITAYDSETDLNKLLGRPNQYISKASFTDTRLEQSDPENPNGGTIETFNNTDDLGIRKNHNENVMKAYPMLTQYLYVNGKYILRLSKDLSPEQAEEYKQAFMSIK